MKTFYQTFDGRTFISATAATEHENQIIAAAIKDSGLTAFAETFDDEQSDEWYGTNRKRVDNILWELFEWCMANKKTVKIVDTDKEMLCDRRADEFPLLP